MPVPEIALNYRMLVDKTMILFGASGSGKSTIIVDMLYHMRPHIEQIVVFSPSDRNNGTFGAGLVPKPLVHYDVDPAIITTIWERQEALSAIYRKAHVPELIKALFSKADNAAAKAAIRGIEDKLTQFKAECSDTAKVKNMQDMCTDLIDSVRKKVIIDDRDRLSRMSLSEDERYTLKYIDLNPRMLVIFDDCTEKLGKLKKCEALQAIFFRGRHVNITMIMACHDDKAIPTEMKKNAFVQIFTQPQAASYYFQKDSTGLSKEAKTTAFAAIRETFSPLPSAKYQKLLYMRETDQFYRYTAEKHDAFQFGGALVWKYCQRAQSSGENLTRNRFIKDFT